MGRIRLWGATRIEVGARTIEEFPSVKARQLLEVLALNPGVPVGKAALAEALWDGAPPPSYAATLESHVCRVRRLMSSVGLDSAVTTVAGGYALHPAVRVDALEVRHALVAVASSPLEEACHRMEQLAPSPSSDLLASSAFTEYAEAARRDVATLMSAALRRASTGALRAGHDEKAVSLGRRAVQEDTLCDANALALMRALLAIGATCEALRTYADFRDRSREELGVEPGHELQRFYLAVLDQNERDSTWCDHRERAILQRLLSSARSRSDSRAVQGSVRRAPVRSGTP